MTENFLFKAIFISLAVHTAVLCVAYFSRLNDAHFRALRQNQVEVSYRPAHKKSADTREHPIRQVRRLDLSNNPKFYSYGTIPAGLVKEKPMLPLGMFYERKPEGMRTMELSRRVSIMPITSEKINNPVYAAYNEMVRDRIKQKVYENYDKIEGGSVYLTFLLNEKGVLEGSQVIPQKTNASAHLQELSLRSLREAGPFPPFLKGMNLTEYPFNIEIQYEVSD
jgi:hypothetical protein